MTQSGGPKQTSASLPAPRFPQSARRDRGAVQKHTAVNPRASIQDEGGFEDPRSLERTAAPLRCSRLAGFGNALWFASVLGVTTARAAVRYNTALPALFRLMYIPARNQITAEARRLPRRNGQCWPSPFGRVSRILSRLRRGATTPEALALAAERDRQLDAAKFSLSPMRSL